MCMHVFMCAHRYVCSYIHLHEYVYIPVWMCTCMWSCMYICAHVCIFMCVHVHAYECLYISTENFLSKFLSSQQLTCLPARFRGRGWQVTSRAVTHPGEAQLWGSQKEKQPSDVRSEHVCYFLWTFVSRCQGRTVTDRQVSPGSPWWTWVSRGYSCLWGLIQLYRWAVRIHGTCRQLHPREPLSSLTSVSASVLLGLSEFC